MGNGEWVTRGEGSKVFDIMRKGNERGSGQGTMDIIEPHANIEQGFLGYSLKL
jgi:hypothetical protein